MRRRGLYSALFCVLCFSTIVSPCSSREVHGVTFPDTQTIQGTECNLNGVGVRKKLIINIYLGAFYTAKPSNDASEIITSEQIKRVVMHFLYK